MDKKNINYELTNMCMIEDGKGNVLVQDRVKSWKGVTFPGGKIKFNESIIDSVKREIKEETNLTLSSVKFCGIKDWYDPDKNLKYIIFLFKTDDYEGTLLSETNEGKNYWIKKNKIKNQKLAPGFENDLVLFFDDEKMEIFWEVINSDWKRKLY